MDAAELLNTHLHEMTADVDARCALFASNPFMEQPHGVCASTASPLKGIAAISKSVKGFLDGVRELQTGLPNICQVQGADAVFSEFMGRPIVISTGRTCSRSCRCVPKAIG